MQATLLPVLHAPAPVHGPRGAPASDAEDGVFGQALTSASDLIDGSLDGATSAGRALSDDGEPATHAEETPDPTSTDDAPDAASAQDPSAAMSLPAWLAELKGRSDRAGAGRSTAAATAQPDSPDHLAGAGAALTTASRHGTQATTRSALPGTRLAGRAALAPNDTAPAAGGAPVKAQGVNEAQPKLPGRPAETLEAGPSVPGRVTARAGAGAEKTAANGPVTSVGDNGTTPSAGSAEPGVAPTVAGPEGSTSRANATTKRLTVAVEGEKVTIDLRHALSGPARSETQTPEVARAAVLPGTAPPVALRHRTTDIEHRPPDATAAASGQATQARGSGSRVKGHEENTPVGGAPSASPMAGRVPESAPAPVRSPENSLATTAQAPVPTLASATHATAAQATAAQATAALPGAAIPAPRLRAAHGSVAAGAIDSTRPPAAAADRARLAAAATAGPTDAQAAQRPAGSDASAAPAAAQATSWLQALEAAVQQAGVEAPHGVSLDAGGSAGLVAVGGESGTRLEASAPESGATPRIDVAPDSPQFPGMLGARVAAMVRDGIEQARIALNPEELGPVSVQIELAGTQVRVDLAAEVEATRVALEQALPALAGSLREAGFTLAGGGVFQQARDGGSGDPASGGNRQDGGTPTARAAAAEPGPGPRAHRPQGLVDLYA